MTASGRHGSAGTNGRRVEALRDIKEAEADVEQRKEEAREEAEEIVEQARREADELLEETVEEAEKEAELIVTEAREEAQEEAEQIRADAEDEAGDLRNVSETRLEEAAESVIDRFQERVGGS